MKYLPLAALLLTTACASITQGSTQVIAVDTVPPKEAECSLANEKGNWHLPRTPGVASVTKANGALTVTCTAKGGWSGVTTVQSTTAGAAFGNIVAGGIIGAAVDMSSGAAYQYQAMVSVPVSREGK